MKRGMATWTPRLDKQCLDRQRCEPPPYECRRELRTVLRADVRRYAVRHEQLRQRLQHVERPQPPSNHHHHQQDLERPAIRRGSLPPHKVIRLLCQERPQLDSSPSRLHGSPKAIHSGGCWRSPTGTTMYCFPSCMYVMGPPVVPRPRSVSQSTSPVDFW